MCTYIYANMLPVYCISYMRQTTSSFSCLPQFTFCSKYPDATYSNNNYQAPPTLGLLVCIGDGANNATRVCI